MKNIKLEYMLKEVLQNLEGLKEAVLVKQKSLSDPHSNTRRDFSELYATEIDAAMEYL